jgi:hypothetical protein
MKGSVVHASPVKLQTSPSFRCQSAPTSFSIPANFDPLHASTQELHQHYLPSRPSTSDTQAFAHWQTLVHSIKQIVCIPPGGKPLTYHGHVLTAKAALTGDCNNLPSGTECKANWNGYIAGDGTQPGFNDVYGEWNVQCVNTNELPGSYIVSWVGLGGFYPLTGPKENLWQAGSGWDNTGDGYFLWYEAVGANGTSGVTPITINNVEVHPSCGNTLYTEVWFAPQEPTVNVGGLIINETTGVEYWYNYAPQGFSSGNLSAEWIDENPACGNYYTFLADYNYSQWKDAYASANNASAPYYPIGHFAHTRVWAADENSNLWPTPIAWADALGSNNGSGTDNFKTYWQGSGTGC